MVFSAGERYRGLDAARWILRSVSGVIMCVERLVALTLLSAAGQEWFFFANLPMKWVRIVGIVVAIEDFYTRRVYTIDDSSGACIEALVTGKHVAGSGQGEKETSSVQTTTKDTAKEGEPPKEQAPTAATAQGGHIEFPYGDVDIGTIVDIKGSLTTYREEKQIKIEKLLPVRSTMQEVALWEKRNKFHTDVLAKPWVLSPEVVRKCRRKAERSDEQVEKRKTASRGTAPADKEPVPRSERVEKPQKRENGQDHDKKHDKRRRTALQRAEIAKMIHSGGVKGKFSALGL